MFRSKKFWIPVGIVLFLILLSIGMVEYSSKPSFCNLCHVMGPYFEAWKTSSHRDVACVTCHIPPQPKAALWAKFQTINSVVQYVTKRYGTRPHAEIEDASCLRSGCHETRLLKGKVHYKRDIIFDHTEHLEEWKRGKKLRCTSCHSQIVVGNHMEVTDSTCFICHFKGTEMARGWKPIGGCPFCHKAPSEVVEVDGIPFNHRQFVESKKVSCEKCHRDAVQGNGEAPEDRCLNCHNKPERLAKYHDTKFMHITHVTKHKVDCLHCHHEIKHKLTPVEQRHQVRRCELCHMDTHQLTERMLRGEGGRDAPVIPSHMFLARLDCAACHGIRKETPYAPGGGHTMVASEEVCAQCHEEKWKGMLHDWKTTLDRMLVDLQPKLRLAERKVDELSEGKGEAPELRALLDSASYNLEYVRKARGIHNPFYAAELIVVADRNLSRIFAKLGQPAPKLPVESPVRGGYCALLCHRKAGVQTPERVSFEGLQVPHKKHAIELKMGCTRCHSSKKHKAVSIKKEDCSRCHHGRAKVACSRCHAETAALRSAKPLPVEIQGAAPDSMAESVGCEGCHEDPQRHSLQAVEASCLNCHDEPYRGILKGWLGAVSSKQEKLRALEREVKTRLSPEKPRPEALKRLQEGERILTFLERADGVHNPDLADSMSDYAIKRLEEARALLD